MLSNYIQAQIRTFVPVLVTAVTSYLLRFNLHVDNAAVSDAIAAGVGGGYYAIVSKVEQKYPQAGWLLGKPGGPVYGPNGAVAVAQVD